MQNKVPVDDFVFMKELNAQNQTTGIENGPFLIENLLVNVMHQIAATNVLLGWSEGVGSK